MDKWKRSASGSLDNDDVLGYENAKKRVQIKTRKKEEHEVLDERLQIMERKIEHLESSVQGMDLTIKEIIKLCHTITETLKRM